MVGKQIPSGHIFELLKRPDIIMLQVYLCTSWQDWMPTWSRSPKYALSINECIYVLYFSLSFLCLMTPSSSRKVFSLTITRVFCNVAITYCWLLQASNPKHGWRPWGARSSKEQNVPAHPEGVRSCWPLGLGLSACSVVKE